MQKPDLADIVDLRFDVMENSHAEQSHGAQCENLTATTTFCNYIADGANLCARKHSSTWWSFTLCMYSTADPDGLKDKDKNNPLAHAKTFDSQLSKCADRNLQHYSVEDLRTCTYGEEGMTLRHLSAAKFPAAKFQGVVWVMVGDKFVPAPGSPSLPRDTWAKDVVTAVCAAYSGEKPASCSQIV